MDTQFSTKSIIKESWGLTKKNLPFLLQLFGVSLLLSFLGSVIVEYVMESGIVFGFIAQILVFLLQLYFSMGIIAITLKIVKGEEPEWSDLFSQEMNFWQFVLGSVLYALIVLGGTLLLIIPGIVWAITFCFFRYRIVEKGETARTALKESARLTKGRRWKIFVFQLALLGINIVGILCLFVGLFVTVPLSLIAGTLLYKKLSTPQESSVEPVLVNEEVLA